MKSADDYLLKIENLSVNYRSRNLTFRALDNVSLQIGKNEFVAIVGESGSGKSTLALSIIGLLPVSAEVQGTIIYAGVDLLKLKKDELSRVRGTQIGMIFQEPHSSLNPIEKIGNQMADVILTREKRISRNDSHVDTKIVRQEIIEWLSKVRIADPERVRERFPFELSGGMVQRVTIAMALSERPSLLLADEPTTALDVTTQAQILQLMKQLTEFAATSIFLVTHDLAVAAQVANRVFVMYAGDLVEQGSARQVFSNPCHPYTQGLLRSHPSGNKKEQKLETLYGSIPNLTQEITGCKFAGRCKLAKDDCRSKKIEYVEVESGHFVRCVLY